MKELPARPRNGLPAERGQKGCWSLYKNEKYYDQSFVFVTSKKLKYKYSQYANVVTRATLKKTLALIFQKKKVGIGKEG